MATVCANILASKAASSVEVRMWVREPSHLAELEKSRENKRYLAGTKLAPALRLMRATGNSRERAPPSVIPVKNESDARAHIAIDGYDGETVR